ncbi:PREDICTED: small G protein signaling modulator 1-like isoform X3 [Camelina sativa]|uniref:Small G protein signaling modulator 1-like isoform X1 n=1 Tax=Camelina sativa TaxID=90675 RepID=A0ABM0UHU6_CAMSA|nr:PREDICTED: small G protein signaling modulator 1-like isoform X1 [Camelina sativa]XP_010441374.1 PREDICTED: small G protein signaling modulator 1-like isoform X2 [Camelina sativa]XP_010441375.1 PREDICTED: small G protein signaling modulator 1-like isoform X3 [Camelina sativa]
MMFPRLRLTKVFFSLVLAGKWIVFADGSSGGGARNGYSGGLWSSAIAPSNVGLAVAVTVMAGLAVTLTVVYSRRGSIGSPWSLRRRKHVLQPEQWNAFFTEEGRLSDGGVKFLKKVRSGGVHPSIRPEVWPFLLGVYDLNSTKEERDSIRQLKQTEYENLRRQCREIHERNENGCDSEQTAQNSNTGDSQVLDSHDIEEVDSSTRSVTVEESEKVNSESIGQDENCEKSDVTIEDAAANDSDSTNPEETETSPLLANEEAESHNTVNHEEDNLSPSSKPKSQAADEDFITTNDSDSTNPEDTETSPLLANEEAESHNTVNHEEDNLSPSSKPKSQAADEDFITTNDSDSTNPEDTETSPLLANEEAENNNTVNQEKDNSSPSSKPKSQAADEDFITTWQRIIRLDAVRANDEWVPYSPSQAAVSETKARGIAIQVGLNDYDHLEPCRIFHAARLVGILEAYAVYDPEIGYCQGMSDLLSPLIAVMEDDVLAFWCFVGFMSKARHNFRLDEVGIRRQLSMVSKIIKFKDIHLYRHLENLEAEDCFFVYRMVVVLFRRELTFEQTLCLWEVMWADQAAIRTGIAKATWGRIRLRAPPTEDLLLYAIAASVLQRRKTIIEKYSGMDEIMKECNSMAGHLDVWKLLDDAHDLVVNLHDKI